MKNKEKLVQGKIGLSLYIQYFSAGGGIFLTSLMFCICILTQVNVFLYISSIFKKIKFCVSLLYYSFVLLSVVEYFKIIVIKNIKSYSFVELLP